jgi:hypothetical protein
VTKLHGLAVVGGGEQRKLVLHEQIVPMVKQAPGFVSGYLGTRPTWWASGAFVVRPNRLGTDLGAKITRW